MKPITLFLTTALLLSACTRNEKIATTQNNSPSKATTTITRYSFVAPTTRLALDHDGNYHDRDDICSVSMELGLLAHAGWQSKVVYFSYSNHYWKNTSTQEAQEDSSVLQTARIWGGFDLSKFVETRLHHSTAVSMLVSEINKSTSTDSLIIVGAGPMEVVGQAIAASDPAHRKYVRLISHSIWNGEHAGRYGPSEALAYPYYNFNTYSTFPHTTYISKMGVQETKIVDQNTTVSKDYSYYSWLENATDPRLKMIWHQCHDVAAKTTFDCSDAGMVYYLISGDQYGSPAKLQKFFGL